jgi:hypothetical protein
VFETAVTWCSPRRRVREVRTRWISNVVMAHWGKKSSEYEKGSRAPDAWSEKQVVLIHSGRATIFSSQQPYLSHPAQLHHRQLLSIGNSISRSATALIQSGNSCARQNHKNLTKTAHSPMLAKA